MAEYDEEQAVRALADGIVAAGEMRTMGLKYDTETVADVVRVVRAIGRAVGNDTGRRQLGPYVPPA